MHRLVWVFAGRTGHFVGVDVLWLNRPYFDYNFERLKSLQIIEQLIDQVWNRTHFLAAICIRTDKLDLINEPHHDKTNKMTCAPSEASDQPGHPPRLIRVFAVRSVVSQGSKVSSCGQRRLWSVCADAQADLSHCWAHRSVLLRKQDHKWKQIMYLNSELAGFSACGLGLSWTWGFCACSEDLDRPARLRCLIWVLTVCAVGYGFALVYTLCASKK